MQARLLALPESDDATRIAVQLELAGRLGVTLAELSLLTDIAPKTLEKQLQAMSGRGLAFCWDKDAKSWIAAPALEVLSSKALEAVETFHTKNPLQPGMAKGVVLAGMGRDVPPSWPTMFWKSSCVGASLLPMVKRYASPATRYRWRTISRP